LQLWHVNKEYFVNTIHKIVLIKSLAFVHTARRFYRLMIKVRNWEEKVVRRSVATLEAHNSNFVKSLSLEEEEVVTRYQ